MNKICTSQEQSKKLMELGIGINSADMHYVRQKTDFMGKPVDGKWSDPKYGNPEKANYIVQNFSSYEKLPAWSLSALLNYLREIDFFPEIDANELEVTMSINYYNEDEAKPLAPVHNIKVKAESFIDACVEVILNLHKLNLL